MFDKMINLIGSLANNRVYQDPTFLLGSKLAKEILKSIPSFENTCYLIDCKSIKHDTYRWNSTALKYISYELVE